MTDDVLVAGSQTGDPRQADRARSGEAWDPQLLEEICGLLYGTDPEAQDLDLELQRLEEAYDGSVYSELIYLLSHLRFGVDEAREHWSRIVAHRASMETRLDSTVDLRVALVSYFVEVNRQFENPKVIELKLFEQAQATVYRDELTGLYNYRFFRESLKREMQRSARGNTPISLVMIDVDDFKTYNDLNGHEAGNDALSRIGSLFQTSMRRIDIAARYGGEEFALILPETPKTGAQIVAERTRCCLEDYAFDGESEQPGGKLTASLGVATCPADGSNPSELIRAADRALYLAKGRGKNSVSLYQQDRRLYPRYDVRLQGRFRKMSTRTRPLTTLNICESGVLFHSPGMATLGSMVEAELTVPETGRTITVLGRVAKVVDSRDGGYDVGLEICQVGRADRAILSALIHELAGETR